MKTIAQQLNVTEFPFRIKDKNGNTLYYEDSNKFWVKYEYDSNGKYTYGENSNEVWTKREYDSDGNEIYYEDSEGKIRDKRPKPCENKVVEVDGIKYRLVKVNS
jgi:hypothetical protein